MRFIVFAYKKMIEHMHIENIATYSEGVDIFAKKINFIYGGNGTGKSTISRFMSGEEENQESFIKWQVGEHEEIVVYNKNFIENNFKVDKDLKGIFTLGTSSIAFQQEIEKNQNSILEAKKQIVSYENSISNLLKEQRKLQEDLATICWSIQQNYGSVFAKALVGYRNSKKKFFEKCISMLNTVVEKDDFFSFDEVKNMYMASYDKEDSLDENYKIINLELVKKLDSNFILEKVITGKTDTPIGQFIEYLHSSSWMQQGIEYAKKSSGKCPYCQRLLTDDIKRDIENYFDETYEKDKNTVNKYLYDYQNVIVHIKDIVKFINDNKKYYIDYSNYDDKIKELMFLLDKNLNLIEQKNINLSKKITIQSITSFITEIDEMIVEFNKKIDIHNKLVSNQEESRKKCQFIIWKFLIRQCFKETKHFERKIEAIEAKEKGKRNLENKKTLQEKTIQNLKKNIAEKESQITNIRQSVDDINSILLEFGFTGFKLEINGEKPGTYKIVRPSGEGAINNLSEGEYHFISFLYFYHLCFGSQERARPTFNKILVIDDPVSSMDSNVLFIVAMLVKNILKYCKENKNFIKQIFILTHNVYFHKEITFWGNKEALPSKETCYFVLRKKDEITNIVKYDNNPIKTSYELLWQELNKSNSININLNVMRRILEHYFNMIGNVNYESCINQFEGTDKIVCRALIAFVNEGSHSVFDDLTFNISDETYDTYMKIFKKIFEKLGHIHHYDMMMNKLNQS